MTLYFTVERSDGSQIAGPYTVPSDGVTSITLVDIAPAGSPSYWLNVWSDSGDTAEEIRVTAMVAKR